jgi:CheY-like chemotaxis protein
MTKHGTILVVEDETSDALVKQAFAENGVSQPLRTVHSSEEAVKYLSGSGKFSDRKNYPLPFLVLVDLTMANEAGFAFLRWLYERPGLKKKFMLVVLGPAAASDSEIQLTYELGVQSYLSRHTDFASLTAIVRALKEYWIELNRHPESV